MWAWCARRPAASSGKSAELGGAENAEGVPGLGRKVEDGPTFGDGTVGGPVGGKVVAQACKRGFQHAVAAQVAQYAFVTVGEVLVDL